MQLRFSALNLRPFAALLILVALLMGSAIDAAACEPEFVAHSQAEVSADGSGEQDPAGKDKKHGVCAHGHCHHASQAVGHTAEAGAAIATPLILFGSPPAGLTGTLSSPPKQPPRV